MSEPKRGRHSECCVMTRPNCQCNSCQKDIVEYACCVDKKHGMCSSSCRDYIKDEPTKKGADHE